MAKYIKRERRMGNRIENSREEKERTVIILLE